MSRNCPDPGKIAAFLEGEFASSAERSGWQAHLKQCSACRKQLELDRELRQELGTIAIPGLSPGFDRRLRISIAKQQRLRRSVWIRQGILQGYWAGFVLAVYLVLESVELPIGMINSNQLTGVILLLTAILLPVLLLVRRFRLSLVDLLIDASLDPRFD